VPGFHRKPGFAFILHLMSIAVSADIKPSRLIFIVMASACAGVALIGIGLSLLMPGHPSLSLRVTIAVVCILAAALALFSLLRSRKTIWLHISGTGQIRVVEHLLHGNTRAKPQVMKAGLAQLLSGTTIWPGMLFLRLKLENGKTRTIPILPDCVPDDTFRALTVACRWLISHNVAKAQLMEK
jgi:hypothetical protein